MGNSRTGRCGIENRKVSVCVTRREHREDNATGRLDAGNGVTGYGRREIQRKEVTR